MTECPIPCNLCGGTDVEVVGERDRRGRPLRTTICRACGLVWSNPRPAEEAVRRYYAAEYRLDYKGQQTPSPRHVARSARGAFQRCRGLAPYLRPGMRILDAGAGGGEMVYALRRLGYDAEGIEPDQSYARHAREVLEVPVATGFIQDVDYADGLFDIATMYHALEHVEDPVGILTRLRRWIKDGGMLVLEVPNVEARCIAPSHRFHFAHFYNFNQITLEETARRAGFAPVASEMSADGGNLTTICRATGGARPFGGAAGNCQRVLAVMRSHTTLSYLLSSAPYTGPLGRLRTYLRDRHAASGCRTPREVLDRMLRQGA